MNRRRSFIVYTLILINLFNLAFAVEVLTDTGQRQTVVERTKQYAGSVDAIKIRNEMATVFKKNLKHGDGSSIYTADSKCGGYNISSCGLPCCGKSECQNICKANTTLAHGNTCLSTYTTSRCGMSCCGKQDCDTVCDNYRTSTVSQKKCGGYVKTATGGDCCGYKDCRERSCGGQTSVISNDFGTEMECCGADNCNDVKCDYQHSTEVISGGNVKCCGTKDCYSKYCEGQTSVDSKVDPNKKNLQCCGTVNCHNIECDGYVTTKSPSGDKQCCGYDDCRLKECEGRLTALGQDGKTVPCCGYLECGNIEFSRTYEEPNPNATAIGRYTINRQRWVGPGRRNHKLENNYGILTVQASGFASKVMVTTGVAKKIPSGCTQVSMDEYDGIKYYKYKCKTVIGGAQSLNDLYDLEKTVYAPGIPGSLPSFIPRNIYLVRKNCPSCPKLRARAISCTVFPDLFYEN
ncbi:hypothetical protein [Succinivibrio dextrinosolvens]|uniref:hypothetical protein n=1 Tax=Succinivibrio dextrinosolvens TaxID=83771 RepID=UPI00241C5236|nr:hypothetical protein [Succinivibrio dextrinosolvens]MBE6422820.1 hypothetical protein [Succinivibrio dextrinosolvens]